MKVILGALAAMLLALSLRAASAAGDITLPFSLTDTNRTVSTRPFGDVVKATWSCRAGEFYGWETVFAQVTVTNTGSKPMWGECCLAFYDMNKNLVGTAAQMFTTRRGLRPRTSRTLSLCRIILPRDKYKEIVSCRAVLQETDTPPLKGKNSILLEEP